MPKIDKDILHLINSLKKFNMHKIKSNTKFKGGNGDYSCISMEPIHCETNEWKSKYLNDSIPLITKIITRKDIFDRELAIAKYIDNNFIYDSKLLYALEACILPSSDKRIQSILEKCTNVGKMHKGKDMETAQLTFDRNATTAYLFQIEHGGVTLENFMNSYEIGDLDDDILYNIIKDILNIINELHSKNIAHKDIKKHSNITLKEINGRYKVGIIDFGEATLDATLLDKKVDIEDSLEIIQNIAGKMQNTEFKRKLTNLKIKDIISTLIYNLTKAYDQFKGVEMTEEEKLAELARRAEEFAHENPYMGSPEKQGIPPPALPQFDSPPPSGRNLLNSFDSPPSSKKPRQGGNKKK